MTCTYTKRIICLILGTVRYAVSERTESMLATAFGFSIVVIGRKAKYLGKRLLCHSTIPFRRQLYYGMVSPERPKKRRVETTGEIRRDTNYQSFRKFRSKLGPWVVRKLSGWNCTPSRGNSL